MCDVCITITNYYEDKYLCLATVHKSIETSVLQKYVDEIFNMLLINDANAIALICIVYDTINDTTNIIVAANQPVLAVKSLIYVIANASFLEISEVYTIDYDAVSKITCHMVSNHDFGCREIYQKIYLMVAKNELPAAIYYSNKNLKKITFRERFLK